LRSFVREKQAAHDDLARTLFGPELDRRGACLRDEDGTQLRLAHLGRPIRVHRFIVADRGVISILAMPWREATLRGQRVLARVKDDGTFDAKDGRVEIRYRPTDTKAYDARTSNLVIPDDAKTLPDEWCVAREAGKKAKVAAPNHADYKDAWIAYTDGACTGNPGPAGSGTVVIAPGGKIRESYAYLGEATNNIAELQAIENALVATPAKEALVLHTDSQYAIGVLTKGWKAKANAELIERIRKALGPRKVRFVYVPGHAGVPMNERADELAREAIKTRRDHEDT